ncbi:MAG TPA: porin family protein [Flavobacteriales bacterium]|nr:porin family protein [Flavobacteriales bacterium]
MLGSSATTLSAQKRKVLNLPNYDKQTIHFGFLLGTNSFNFIPTPVKDLRDIDSVLTIQQGAATGFTLGIISNLHMGDNFDLRFMPTLSFGERRLDYKIRLVSQNDSIINRAKRVESTFLEFPLLLKFKSSRLNNGRAYIIGGVKSVIDLASQDKVDDKGEKILKLKRNDFNYEIGFGFDFYSQYFKFTPEFKMSYGLKNLLVQDNNLYTLGLSSIHSKAFYISFTFE